MIESKILAKALVIISTWEILFMRKSIDPAFQFLNTKLNPCNETEFMSDPASTPKENLRYHKFHYHLERHYYFLNIF